MNVDWKRNVDIFSKEIAMALNAAPSGRIETTLAGDFASYSIFRVSDLALASIHAAGNELALLTGAKRISLDRSLTECWFGMTVRPIGWTLPGLWDPIAGNYEARDGWVRLHTNVPAHLRATLRSWRAGKSRRRCGGRRELALFRAERAPSMPRRRGRREGSTRG